MIEERKLFQEKYYLIGIIIAFSIIMVLLFHIRSYFLGLIVLFVIFIFWLNYPRTLVYFLFWSLASGGVIEVLFARRYLGYMFILFALMFLLGKHVLVEDCT